MSENIEKLREAISRRLRVRMGLITAVEFEKASLGLQDALALVEKEMLMRTRSEAYLAERIEALEAQQAQRAQEMAALEAERDELKKRPTYKEVTRAIWEGTPMGVDGNGIRIEVARNVDKLFDGKAHQ